MFPLENKSPAWPDCSPVILTPQATENLSCDACIPLVIVSSDFLSNYLFVLLFPHTLQPKLFFLFLFCFPGITLLLNIPSNKRILDDWSHVNVTWGVCVCFVCKSEVMVSSCGMGNWTCSTCWLVNNSHPPRRACIRMWLFHYCPCSLVSISASPWRLLSPWVSMCLCWKSLFDRGLDKSSGE